ncbi:MAG: MMPL family transporter [Dehalococcoidia bacterium]
MVHRDRSPSSVFEKLAHLAYRRRWHFIGGWIAGIAVLFALLQVGAGEYATEFTIPGSESQAAADLLDENFPAWSGSDATLIFQSDSGLSDPQTQRQVEDVLGRAEQLPGVIEVTSPLDEPTQVSDDGTIAYATLRYAASANDIPAEQTDQLYALVETYPVGNLKLEVGGDVVETSEGAVGLSSEFIGLAAAAVILVFVFGSIVAMGVPILTALFPLSGAIATLGLAAAFFDLPEFTVAFASMIGLGVSIDYALFVITRFREGLHRGESTEDALVKSLNTAGRSVLFAGSAVVIAMAGLTLIGIPFVAGLGRGSPRCPAVGAGSADAPAGASGRHRPENRLPGNSPVQDARNQSRVFSLVSLQPGDSTPAADLRRGRRAHPGRAGDPAVEPRHRLHGFGQQQHSAALPTRL